METNPSEVRSYVERLLDEGRVAPALMEVAKTVRPRFAEPSEATDSKKLDQSAEHFLRIWEMRFESVKRTGASHGGFQETLDCLKSDLDPKAGLRLLTLHNDGPLFAFLVEVASERLVGLVFVDSAGELTDDYGLFVQQELSKAARSSDPARIDFEYLRPWARWPEEKLRSIYSEVTHAWALRVQEALGSEEERATKVESESFPGLVRALQVRMHQGSRDLGETIVEGSKLVELGKLDEARIVYEAFLERCPSRFYRRIAKYHMQDLDPD